jgi:hypothetical protein
MDFSEEAAKLELAWLESGQLEDVDDNFIKENLEKRRDGELPIIQPQYSGSNFFNEIYTNYNYNKLPSFEFSAVFVLENFAKLDFLMNFLQQKDIIISSYYTDFLNDYSYTSNIIAVKMKFVVPGYKMNGTSYKQLFEEIKEHLGVSGKIENINMELS